MEITALTEGETQKLTGDLSVMYDPIRERRLQPTSRTLHAWRVFTPRRTVGTIIFAEKRDVYIFSPEGATTFSSIELFVLWEFTAHATKHAKYITAKKANPEI